MPTAVQHSPATEPVVETMSSERFRDADGRIFEGWKTTVSTMVGASAGPSCILVFCFGSFVVPLQREFGWAVSQIMFGATIVALMIIVTSLLGGMLVDWIGSRKLVVCSMPLFAAGVAGMSLLPNSRPLFYAALVALSLAGIGVGPVSYMKAVASWFDRRLGLSLGFAATGLGIGAAIMPALLSHVIPNYGWRHAFVMLGVIAFLPWPIALFFFKERRVAGGTPSHISAAGLSFREAGRTAEFKLLLGGFAILGAATATVIANQVNILVDFGMSMRDSIALQSILGIALIVSRVGTGWLLDRVRASRIMAALCFAGAIGLALFASGSPLGSAPLSAALAGALIGAELDVLGYLIPRYFGFRAYGSIWGALFSMFQLCSAVSIALTGLARTRLGSYQVPLSVLAVSLLFGALLFAQLGAYRFATAKE